MFKFDIPGLKNIFGKCLVTGNQGKARKTRGNFKGKFQFKNQEVKCNFDDPASKVKTDNHSKKLIKQEICWMFPC